MFYQISRDAEPMSINLDYVVAIGAASIPTPKEPYGVWLVGRDPDSQVQSFPLTPTQYLEILDLLRLRFQKTSSSEPGTQTTSSEPGTQDPKYQQCQNAEPEDDVNCPKEERYSVKHVWDIHPDDF
jgi:hypothetical protein